MNIENDHECTDYVPSMAGNSVELLETSVVVTAVVNYIKFRYANIDNPFAVYQEQSPYISPSIAHQIYTIKTQFDRYNNELKSRLTDEVNTRDRYIDTALEYQEKLSKIISVQFKKNLLIALLIGVSIIQALIIGGII